MSDIATKTPPEAPERAPSPKPRRDALWWVRKALWLAVLLLALALPLYLEAEWLKAGQYMMVGAVGAIGLTLLTGQAGQLSLAHAFFLLAGGTAYTVLAGPTGDPELVGFGLDPLLALLGAIAICALLGLAFAPVAGRLRGIYLGVASLALVFLGLYFGQAAENLTGGTSTGRPPAEFSLFGFPFSNEGDLEILGVPIRATERVWYLFLALTVIAFLLARGAVGGRVGRAWRAVRDNEPSAAVMGVSVWRAKAGAFAVSSAYAGLAGVMTVLWFDLLKPDESEFGTYGINVSIAYLAMIIIGGLGSVPGALVGALLVNGLPQVLALYSTELGWSTGTGEHAFTPILISSFVYGAAIILVVLFEPGGLAAIGRRIAGRLSGKQRERKGT
ncbi:branched-chain amino acid ABC transporter permease [Prauserella sp. PE36]|uniref:Branched-chain amino acid ABC transporter permease n=1 Tax=Prauserella endophytica TaxID=1592324 RepID=A0ABY2S303_9PSEU|nr:MULTISPECIES: branched-chain amino acid ABC transporter permease [Prauserella]RBM23130.1 branched-chain amino acid ABC transporter permease [Prauserella sp. PE36]TKG69942.1 branched-chain amino acid ABC transporter permease [Prauserella endophytica]